MFETQITWKPDCRVRVGVVTTQKAFVNIFLVYLLLFVSGTWRYMLSADKFLVIAFFIVLVAWFLFSDRKIADRFLLYVTVFSGFLVVLHIYTGGSSTLASVISSTMKITLAYLVIRTVGEHFVDTYVKVLVYLAIFSLIGYTTDILHLFDGPVHKLPRVGDMGYEGIFYLFRCPHHMERNNSIFFEPGAYQAFLNAAIFMLFFVKTGFTNKKKYTYIAILVAALITTFSTTGLLIFVVMLSLFFYRSDLLTATGKIKVIGVVAVIVSIFAGQFYSAVVVKVEEYLSADEYDQDSSAKIRSSHAKTDLKIFRNHVFGVGHQRYKQEFGVAGRFDLMEANTSSNGVTKTLAIYGLPFSLFIFGSYFWAMRRMLNDLLLSVVSFGMFIMFLTGESYYMSSPISFAIIAAAFVFKSASLRESYKVV